MRLARPIPVLLWSLLAAASASAQPYLVRDLETAPAPVFNPVSGLQPFGSRLFFFGSDQRNGTEPWVSDGTPAGTRLLLDIAPGGAGLQGTTAVTDGSNAYFVADDQSFGPEIWRTDGTAAGTVRLTSFPPLSQPGELAFAGTTLYVVVQDPVSGAELWKADAGAPFGASLVRDIVPGTDSSAPSNLVAVGSQLVFTVGPLFQHELWASDGTFAGTLRLGDDANGPSAVDSLAAGAAVVYFSGWDLAHGSELWRSDGTPAGTVRVVDVVPGPQGSEPDEIGVSEGAVFFAATTAAGDELWKSDGTAPGTVLVADLTPGPEGSNIRNLTTVGARAFFQGAPFPLRLWTSDGTATGTVVVSPPTASSFDEQTAHGGSLYFVAQDAAAGPELWRSDGTPAGTHRVVDLRPGPLGSSPRYLTSGPGFLFFEAGAPQGDGLYKTDGTAAGTQIVSMPPPSTATFGHRPLGEAGQKLVFQRESQSPEPLWASDGTEAGTAPLAPACEPCVAQPSTAQVGDRLFFAARDSAHGYEPWMTDGSGAGTQIVTDLNPGPANFLAYPITAVGRQVFFSGPFDLSGDYFLGVLDGTAPDPEATVFSPYPGLGVAWKGRFFYTRRGEDDVDRLWSSDGTVAGTAAIAVVPSSTISEAMEATPATLFTIMTVVGTSELWKSDGTPAGTRRVLDLCAVPGCDGVDSHPFSDPLVAIGDTLFFFADDGVHGDELWKSDGTTGGTSMVKDLRLGPDGSEPRSPTAMAGILYFFADDGVSGRELWRSDGTAPGTFRVADIQPGQAGGIGRFYQELVPAAGRLYFAAHTYDAGLEPWSSDGTEAGTTQLADIVPGIGGSGVGWFTLAGPRLYFSADDAATGFEPWALDLGPTLSLGVADTAVVEGDAGTAPAAFEVRLAGTLTAPATVTYTATDGTASGGSDYVATSGVLTFVPGGPAVQTVTVPVTGDQAQEADESFHVLLSAVTGASIDRGSADGVILDDDPVAVSTADVTVAEGDAGTTPMTFTVMLETENGGSAALETTVGYATRAVTATEGTDYQAAQGTITFPPGSANGATRTVVVSANGDTIDEADEIFSLDLTPQSVVTTEPARGTVRDDDGTSSGPVQGLLHGSTVRGDLAPLAAASGDSDVYAMGSEAFASYEIVADEVSGSLGPLQLERLDADDTTVLSAGVPVGSGTARALRWLTGASPLADKIRVRSGGCSSACTSSDVYRLRVRETTYRIARFNSVDDQRSVVVVQNLTDRPVQGEVQFWLQFAGTMVPAPLTLPPHGVQAVQTPTSVGSVTVAHDGGYGALAGKAVQTDVVTGACFDTPMEPRAH